VALGYDQPLPLDIASADGVAHAVPFCLGCAITFSV
jgi:hypothetical protein